MGNASPNPECRFVFDKVAKRWAFCFNVKAIKTWPDLADIRLGYVIHREIVATYNGRSVSYFLRIFDAVRPLDEMGELLSKLGFSWNVETKIETTPSDPTDMYEVSTFILLMNRNPFY